MHARFKDGGGLRTSPIRIQGLGGAMSPPAWTEGGKQGMKAASMGRRHQRTTKCARLWLSSEAEKQGRAPIVFTL